VGILGVGIINSTAFSILPNSSPEVNKIQIPFGTIDFQPHQSSFTQVFESMDQDMDLTIGSLKFHVGSLGSICLSDPAKPDPSASKSKTETMLESSEGSSSEVNSLVSFSEIEIEERKFAEGDETMENFDLEVQLEDLMICHDDNSDKSTYTWKTGLELHEDDNSIFSSFDNKFDNRYQVLAITEDNSEEFDENNNPVLNPANINRGANHLAEGETTDSLANKEKVRLSVDEWRTIKTAVEHYTPIPNNASKNMLLGYHYALRQQSKQLAKERIEIQKRRDSAIVASDAYHRARSDASYMNNKRHHRHRSRYENLKYSDRQSLSKNLDSSFLSVDEQGNIIPKTSKAALVAAQAYLHTTRPNPGDPREHMHRVALQRLKMVGNKLLAKEEEAYRNKGIHKPRSSHCHNSPRHRRGSRRSRTPSPGRHKSPKHKGTRRSRTPNKAYDYEDDGKEMGASCFTHRVRIMPVPKGFKLPHHQQKYDGSREPQSWLSDYLQAVKLLGGTRETAMQSLQLHLTGATRSWLNKLEKETIGSWEELTKQFTSNFKSTYKWPASIEEVKACVQQRNETLRAYIQTWSIIKNSAVKVLDERAIDAFTLRLWRGNLAEEMGRLKPKMVSDLMDIANIFADGEDACNNKQTRSPEDDRGNRYGGQRRRSRNYDNYDSHSQVAAGYKDNSYQGNDRRNSGYRSYGKEDYGSSRKFQTREPREYNSIITRRYAKRTMSYTLRVC
jgi:hypothetical protein